MKKEVFERLVERFNNGLLPIVDKAVSEYLGVNVKFELSESHRGNDYYLTLKENGEDVTKQLTASPLLKAMFKSGSLECSTGYDVEADKVGMRVSISYAHPGGGFNGRNLCMVEISKDNQVTIEEWY